MKTKLAFLALSATLLASPAQAQWQSYTPGNANGGFNNPAGYWNNRSDDGLSCNIGFIVDGTTGSCSNQKPAGWLPSGSLISGGARVLQTAGGAPIGFYFGAGTWTLNLIGRAAGAEVPSESQWGYFNGDDLSFTAVAGSSATVTTSTGFALFVDSWNPSTDPRRFYSSGVFGNTGAQFGIGVTTNQFAVFTSTEYAFTPNINEFGVAELGLGRYVVGAEDNACDIMGENGPVIGDSDGQCVNGMPNSRLKASDRDYNDFVIEVVPEPSSFALVTFGLAGLAAVANRRRRA